MVLSCFSRTFLDITSGDGSLAKALQDSNQNCSVNGTLGALRTRSKYMPSRSSTNMIRAQHMLRKQEDAVDEETAEYQKAVAESLNTNDIPGSRILRYKATVRDSASVKCITETTKSSIKASYKRAIPQTFFLIGSDMLLNAGAPVIGKVKNNTNHCFLASH
ncbi:unnamed protein product [Trichobilharzia regenti]|nr:unnamed protein product [Trichobilharzia regenti]